MSDLVGKTEDQFSGVVAHIFLFQQHLEDEDDEDEDDADDDDDESETNDDELDTDMIDDRDSPDEVKKKCIMSWSDLS